MNIGYYILQWIQTPYSWVCVAVPHCSKWLSVPSFRGPLAQVCLQARCFLEQPVAIIWNTHTFNLFCILTEYLSCTVAVALAVWGATAKLARISCYFFTISETEDSFLLQILAIWDRCFSPSVKCSHLFFERKLFTTSLWHVQVASITTPVLCGH